MGKWYNIIIMISVSFWNIIVKWVPGIRVLLQSCFKDAVNHGAVVDEDSIIC